MLQNPNDFTKNVAGQAGKHLITSITKPREKGGDEAFNMFLLYAFITLLFVGADGIKVMLRTNFGRNTISIFRVGLCGVAFIIWGVISVGLFFNFFSSPSTFSQGFGGSFAFLLAGIFYLILGIVVFVFGGREKQLARLSKHEHYSGDSIFFGYLMKKQVTNRAIQLYIEPFVVFSIGVFLGNINLMLGLPLFASGISLFFIQLYESFLGIGPENHMPSGTSENTYTEIN